MLTLLVALAPTSLTLALSRIQAPIAAFQVSLYSTDPSTGLPVTAVASKIFSSQPVSVLPTYLVIVLDALTLNSGSEV